jgi:tRNA (guanine10-N2)-dimethyltransferase
MKLLFELSKEYEIISCDEVCATLDAEKVGYTVVYTNDDVLVVDVTSSDSIIQRLAERLAMTFVINTLLFSCTADLNDITRCARHHPLLQKGSIAIRCNNRSSISSDQLIGRLGDVYTKNRVVNLTRPDIELRAVITDDVAFVGMKQANIDTSVFQKRRGHLRPFPSPITLHPKIARALVNLSRVKKHDTLLDPFCGTGGILIEAGLLGVHIIGSDIEQKMIDGCRKNLDFYDLRSGSLYCADIGDIVHYLPPVDAIVTDFPYARSTTTKGEQLLHLYSRAFETIAELLKPRRWAVVGLSSKETQRLGNEYLSVITTYSVKSHRSLTRYFVVYQK